MNIMKCCLMLLLLTSGIVSAQTLKVTGFRLLPDDYDASVNHKVEDGNGDLTALIKVRTTEKGFDFAFGGNYRPIVPVDESRKAEIWVYTSPGVNRISVSHSKYGRVDYVPEIAIESGKTYELLLIPGNGRYVTILGQDEKGGLNDAEVFIDNEYFGKTPLIHVFQREGRHHIRVVKESTRQEGELTVDIATGESVQVIPVDMKDMSPYYGTVNIEVANDPTAEIWYGGKKVGVGFWNKEWKAGQYEIETRKPNCEPSRTMVSIEGGKSKDVKITAPRPHTGFLNIYTRPRNLNAIINDKESIDLTERMELPIGTYPISFSKKGYIGQRMEYNITRNETIADTVTLQRITYVKPTAFYFGGGVSLRSMSGLTGVIGMVYRHHDVQLSYTFGWTESDTVTWQTTPMTRTMHKMNTLALKYGYQFDVLSRMALTPQIGYAYSTLTTNLVDGSQKYGDGSSASLLTLGLKLTYAPIQHVYAFLSPEFGIAMSKKKQFKSIAEVGDFSAEGFGVGFGFLINF